MAGDMTCATARLYGKDPETEEVGEIMQKVCLTSAACKGGDWADAEGNGVEVKAGACDAAVQLVASAAAIVSAYMAL